MYTLIDEYVTIKRKWDTPSYEDLLYPINDSVYIRKSLTPYV